MQGISQAWNQTSLHSVDAANQGSKLPRLRANANRKAQKIIAAHMGTAPGTSVSSAATVHCLSKVDSTSSRASRSHDISHLCDRAPCLAPSIPPSLVPDGEHEYEAHLLAEEAGGTYNPEDGMWYVKVFPSDNPSSRADAVRLDAWITRSLERYAASAAQSAKEDLAARVEGVVPLLSIGLHELVRQVTHHCVERGTALQKIWRTYVELFDRVLRQMQESLAAQRRTTSGAQGLLRGVRAELRELKKRHPEDMQNTIIDLEKKFSHRQLEHEQELKEAQEEHSQLQQELQAHRLEMDTWFPCFSFYQDSYIRSGLSQRVPTMVDASRGRDGEAVETAIAEDFKRLLAVLTPEKRRSIGQEFASLMETQDSRGIRSGKVGGRRNSNVADTRASRWAALQAPSEGAEEKAKAEAKALERMRANVRAQEARILELREEIARIEREQAAAHEAEAQLAAERLRSAGKPRRESEASEAFEFSFTSVTDVKEPDVNASSTGNIDDDFGDSDEPREENGD